MNEYAYLQQNSLGFEGDTYLRDTCKKLCLDNEIEVIVETGSFKGSSTKHFSKWAKEVYTIEVDPDNYRDTVENLKGYDNVSCIFGNSVDKLIELLPKIWNKKVLFFIDSHWQQYNPLLDELALIKMFSMTPIIAIHDFKVPDKPELEYDVYGDIIYQWSWIEKSIDNIYGKGGYSHYYNSEAVGAKRGVVFIEPIKRIKGLVSCLMLSKNIEFVDEAIACFLEQSYKNTELIVIADALEVLHFVERVIADLGLKNVIVKKSEGKTIGDKRNESLSLSSGEFLLAWDDDDLNHPDRIKDSIEILQSEKADICLLKRVTLFDRDTNQLSISRAFGIGWDNTGFWRYTNDKYDSISIGEDSYFLQKLKKRSSKIIILDKPELFMYRWHGANTVSREHWDNLSKEPTSIIKK